MLPDGWRNLTVADICHFQNGTGFGPEDWDDHGLPIIRIQNLNGGKNFDYYSGPPDERWLVQPGQLLFAWAGTRGVSFGPSVWRGPIGVLNQHIFKVTTKDGIDPDWLFWSLRHVTNRIENNAHGFKATLLHVKKSDIDRQPVAVPRVSEQRRIARVLSTWDKAVVTTENLLANSKKQRLTLTHRLLIGKDKAAWRTVSVGEVANEVSTRNSEGAALPVLACSKHFGFVDSMQYFKKKVFSEDLTNYKVIERGQFGFPSNHIEEGSIGFQTLHDCAIVSPIYTVFEVDDTKVCHGFLYKLLKTEHYRQRFAAATNASVDRRGNLRWHGFRTLRIRLPPLRQQQEISELIDQSVLLEDGYRQQRDKLLLEKQALMRQLLTGERRLKLPTQTSNQEAAP